MPSPARLILAFILGFLLMQLCHGGRCHVVVRDVDDTPIHHEIAI